MQNLPLYVYQLPWDEKTVRYAGADTWCVILALPLMSSVTRETIYSIQNTALALKLEE